MRFSSQLLFRCIAISHQFFDDMGSISSRTINGAWYFRQECSANNGKRFRTASPYKIVIEPLLCDDQKIKRKKFVNWVQTNFRKEDTMRIFFSDEKFFGIDGVYDSQND